MFEVFLLILIVTVTTVCYMSYLYFQTVRAEKASTQNSWKSVSNENICVAIFGAEAHPEGPTPELKARLNTAIELDKQLHPQMFFLYGGIDVVDETEIMKTYLLAHGIDGERITTDPRGFNTRQSLQRLSEQVTKGDYDKILTVSSAYHSWRLITEAKRYSMVICPVAPVHSPETMNRKVHRIRIVSEILATIWYSTPRFLTKHIDTGNDSFRHKIPQKLVTLSTAKQSVTKRVSK